MKRRYEMSPLVIGVAFMLLLPSALSQTKVKGNQSRDKDKVTPQKQRIRSPVYQPPRRGAPKGRVGGGSRGPRDERPVLSLLVPDHTGLTVQEAPDLFWYISALPDHPIELTINDERKIKPILETRLDRPKRPGIQRVRLNQYGLRLEPGVEYQWFVALVLDSESRSKDILAGGWLERVERTNALQQKLTGAESSEVPFIYAQEGLWYDAIQAISNLIEESPRTPVFRQQRAALLDQVGLTTVAAADRQTVRGAGKESALSK